MDQESVLATAHSNRETSLDRLYNPHTETMGRSQAEMYGWQRFAETIHTCSMDTRPTLHSKSILKRMMRQNEGMYTVVMMVIINDLKDETGNTLALSVDAKSGTYLSERDYSDLAK